jgi:hypothetical protein
MLPGSPLLSTKITRVSAGEGAEFQASFIDAPSDSDMDKNSTEKAADGYLLVRADNSQRRWNTVIPSLNITIKLVSCL